MHEDVVWKTYSLNWYHADKLDFALIFHWPAGDVSIYESVQDSENADDGKVVCNMQPSDIMDSPMIMWLQPTN